MITPHYEWSYVCMPACLISTLSVTWEAYVQSAAGGVMSGPSIYVDVPAQCDEPFGKILTFISVMSLIVILDQYKQTYVADRNKS